MTEIEREVSRIKGLKQNQSKSDHFLQKEAQKNITLRELIGLGNFVDEEEKKKARTLFEKYLEKIDFDNFSELSTLSMLVYNEILVDRIQKTINQTIDDKTKKSYISEKLVNSLHDVENQILELKIKLGIDKKDEQSSFDAFQESKRRFNEYWKENKNEFVCTCAKCGNLLLLRRRVTDFEVLVHGSFSGRFWYNQVAIDMIESGKLSKEDYAKIFQTSVDYVNWVISNKAKVISDENK